MDHITEIRIDDLQESPFNPRQIFNAPALPAVPAEKQTDDAGDAVESDAQVGALEEAGA